MKIIVGQESINLKQKKKYW